MSSLLEIVDSVNNFTYNETPKELYTLYSHDGLQSLGYIIPMVAQELIKYPEVIVLKEGKRLQIHDRLSTIELRNEQFARLGLLLKNSGLFDTLNGWRNELYTIYYPSHEPYMLVERSFCPLLGVVMYGVHINGYIPAEASTIGELQFWIPKRSPTKATFPNMLDNTIAGGIGHPYGVYETAVKESYEEAGIKEDYIKQNLKSAGVVSYIFSNEPGQFETEGGLVQPEVEFIYDLPLTPEIEPVPVDHEAEYFQLLTVQQVFEKLKAGEFKPNCALVIIDFLIRHGILTAENEADLLAITASLHRKPPFPIM